MAHGYLHEGYGMWGDFDPDRERNWRDRDRERNWRDRDRGFMLEDRDRDRFRGERSGDEREWFGGRERDEHRSAWEGDRDWPQRHPDFGDRGMSRYGQEHGFGDYDHGRRSYSSNPDDHYRSWRDKQMAALDRDYADYCREREESFHRDFDEWRRQRRGNPQPLQTGMAQTGMSHDPTGMRQAEGGTANPAEADQTPEDTATLGTTSGRRPR